VPACAVQLQRGSLPLPVRLVNGLPRRSSEKRMLFRTKTGGGGGNRTPVRKCSPRISTCLSRFFDFPPLISNGKDLRLGSSKGVRPFPYEPRERSYPASMTPFSAPQEKAGRTLAALRQPERTRSCLRVFCSCLFNEATGPRHATLVSITPVEPISPPFRLSIPSFLGNFRTIRRLGRWRGFWLSVISCAGPVSLLQARRCFLLALAAPLWYKECLITKIRFG